MPLLNRFSLLAAVAIAAPALAASANVNPVAKLVPAQAKARPAVAAKTMTKTALINRIDGRFKVLDTNKDGSLSQAEIAAGQASALQRARTVQQQRTDAEFKKLDANKDNSLSIAEFRAAVPTVKVSKAPDERVETMDSNKDGKVSAEEYRAGPLTKFERLDANKDGTLTSQEVRGARRR
jgi:Ca2+-binding EF-hand superfamily protein